MEPGKLEGLGGTPECVPSRKAYPTPNGFGEKGIPLYRGTLKTPDTTKYSHFLNLGFYIFEAEAKVFRVRDTRITDSHYVYLKKPNKCFYPVSSLYIEG